MGQLLDIIQDNTIFDYLDDNQLEILLRKHYATSYTKNVQYGLVKRALVAKELIRLRRGLYLVGKRHRRSNVNLFSLAVQIYGPSYVSLESALSFYGMIPEAVYTTTCLTTKRSHEFKTEFGIFSYKHVSTRIFQDGVIRKENGSNVFLMATPEKALLDYVFINRKFYNNIQDLYQDLRIEPEIIKTLRTTELRRLLKLYQRANITNFVTMLLENSK